MAELSTTSEGAFDPDGRDFMARNKLTHSKQVSSSTEYNKPNALKNVNNSDSHSGEISPRDDIFEFGDLVSANSTNGEDTDFLGDGDDQWGNDLNRLPRLEFSPDFHTGDGRMYGAQHLQNEGHGLQGVFTNSTSVELDKDTASVGNKEIFGHGSLRLLSESNHKHDKAEDEDTGMGNSEDIGVNEGYQQSMLQSASCQKHDKTLQNNHAHSHESITNAEHRTELRDQYSALGKNTSDDTVNVSQYHDHDQSDMSDGETESWHCHTKEISNPDRVARNQLIAVCTLCALFMVGETVGGVLSNSLALFTDVLHLASDLISFFISLLAIYLSTKPPSRTMSLGYHRAEVLGALFSVFIIWLVTGVLCYMAIERIVHKHYTEVQPNEMLVTASIGVVFNIVMGIVLHTEKCCGGASSQSSFGHGHSHSHNASIQSHHASHHHHGNRSRIAYQPLEAHSSEHELLSPVENFPEVETVQHKQKNINIRAAFIHVVGDIIQSVGVLIASLIIKITDDPKYKLADPVCTFLFSILVLITTITVLRDTLRIIMEGVPRDLTFQGILDDLRDISGVKQVHNLVIWALTIDRNAMAVHLAVEPGMDHQTLLEKASNLMKSKYHFIHTTIQVENYDIHHMDSCERCQLPHK